MASNKVCSVLVLDVGRSSRRQDSEGGESFLSESAECLKRMVTRKIFAEDKDEVGLVVYGSPNTSNTMYTGEDMYENIEVVSEVQLPTWDLLAKIESFKSSEVKNSDWLEALIIALDILRNGSRGKRFKEKQVVLFTNCARHVDWPEDKLETLVQVINGDKVNLVVIGAHLEEGEKMTGSRPLLLSLLTKLDNGASLSLSEASQRLVYFAKKRKNPRKSDIKLDIGDDISIPVVWMKITSDKHKFTWRTLPANEIIQGDAEVEKGEENAERTTGEEVKNETQEEGRAELKYNFVTDDKKVYKFMHEEITLNYADLEALKRQSGPPTFTLIGISRKDNVIPLLYQTSELYTVRPKSKSRASLGMLSALVSALKKADKVGIARRIQVRNGRVLVGTLIPGKDHLGPHFHFVTLPTAEWVRPIPNSIPLKSTQDQDCLKAIDSFIDAMMLPSDIIGPDHKLKLMLNPSLQYSCHLVQERALGRLPKEGTAEVPQFIKEIIDPYPQLAQEASTILGEINKLFPPKKEAEAKLKRKKNPFKTPRDNDLAASPPRTSSGGDAEIEEEQVEGERWKKFKQDISQEIARDVKIANELLKAEYKDETQPTQVGDTLDILDDLL